MTIQHLNGKEVHLKSLWTLGILWLLLGLAMAKEEEAVGFCGAEVKGDGACLLSVPLVEDNKRLWSLKCDGVQSGYVLTLEGHSTMDLHLGITLLGQPGQLESHVVVFVHNLIREERHESPVYSHVHSIQYISSMKCKTDFESEFVECKCYKQYNICVYDSLKILRACKNMNVKDA